MLSGSFALPSRLACARAAGVFSGRALSRTPLPGQGVLSNYRYNHSVSEICSRISTLGSPFRVQERENVRVVNDFDEFHSTVYSLPDRPSAKTEDLVVTVFISKQNTASLSVLDCVDKLSQEFPENRFLVVDVDQVPRAAYDADLQQLPAALLSFGGDVHRALVQETNGYPPGFKGTMQWQLGPPEAASMPAVECVLPERFYKSVKAGIMAFRKSFNGRKIAKMTSRCGTHNYTHGIDTDNLNAKRVGWPTE